MRDLLDSCLYDTKTTCEHIQALVTKINNSRIRRIRGVWEESTIKIRLEANKSTLLMTLGVITYDSPLTLASPRYIQFADSSPQNLTEIHTRSPPKLRAHFFNSHTHNYERQ